MKKKVKAKAVFALVLLMVFAAAITIAAHFIDRNTDVVTGEEETYTEELSYLTLYDEEYGYSHSFENFLFMGTDASGNEEASGGDYSGSMADFTALVIFDKTKRTYAVLQFNRDTMVEVRLMDQWGRGEATANIQLCTAHWYGGTKEQSCENTVDAVSGFLGGLPIDGYYALSMEEIPSLNHSVGGVTLTVEGDFRKVDPTLVEGETITLTDEQAYTYIQSRYGIDDGENLGRMNRQRQFMHAFLEKVQEKVQGDSGFAMDLYGQLKDSATTDINDKQISRMANRFSNYTSMGVFSFEGTVRTGQALGDGVDHAEFYPDEASVIQIMTALYGLEKE